jgi:tetratricopeptide (TPR) repeat protein
VAQEHDFLPRRLTKKEVALAPSNWVKVLSDYPYRRRRALWEAKPGYHTLLAAVMAAVAKRDRHLIDIADELTKENVPRHIYLSLVSSALPFFGEKEKALEMVREAAKLDTSDSTLLSLATETDDLDEKESLAKTVLNQNPKDSEALRHLAYAKYFKGECEEAERLLDEILLNEPCNIYAREFRGNIFFDKKEYQTALEQYLRVKAKVKPTPLSLELKICHCYYLVGKVRKAQKIAKSIEGKIAFACDLECEIERAQELLAQILNSDLPG